MSENPYQSPPELNDDIVGSQKTVSNPYVYKPLAGLLSWNRNLAILTLGNAAIGISVDVLIVTLALDLGADDPASPYSIFVGLSSLLQIIVATAWNVCFVMATYRVAANAHALSDFPPFYAPSYAAGSYFIPFYNFVRPYQAMKECYESCNATRGWLLLGWWASHLSSNFLGFVSYQVWRSASSSEMSALDQNLARLAVTINAIELPCVVLLAVLSHTVISRLATRQAEMAIEKSPDHFSDARGELAAI